MNTNKFTSEDLGKLSKEELIQKAIQLQTEIEAAQAKIDWYYEQYLLSKQALFGKSTEQAVYGQLELPILNEAEAFREMVNVEATPDEIITSVSKPKKNLMVRKEKSTIRKPYPTLIICRQKNKSVRTVEMLFTKYARRLLFR